MLRFVIKRQKLGEAWFYFRDLGNYAEASRAGSRPPKSFPSRNEAEAYALQIKKFENKSCDTSYSVVLLDEYECEAQGKTMENWRRVWREGVAPLLSDDGLAALKAALEKDDGRLLQGATTSPPPLQCVRDWPVEAACALGYCGWVGDGLETVAEVEEYFARMCFEIDQRLGEPAACRYALNWFDETPRDEMRRELLPEVVKTLEERAATTVAA